MKDLAGVEGGLMGRSRCKELILRGLQVCELAGHLRWLRVDALSRPAGTNEHEMDAEQSDAPEGGRGIRGGEFVRARNVGEFCGGGTDDSGDLAGRAGWPHRAAEK